jgi:TIR domain
MADSIAAASGRIFVSYRREETAYPAGWLYDRLADRFGSDQVFKDVDSIELGDDFVEVITRAVGACDVLLALIGREWLTITDARGRRRLSNPHDFVRLEIEAALTRKVRVIPILVDGASMPDAAELPKSLARLVRRQALELSPSRFTSDTGRLLNVLERTLVEVRTEHDDAASLREPAEKPPAPSTTKDQEASERREPAEPTPTTEVPPATPATPPTARPATQQSEPPAPSTTELREVPERQEAQRKPTPSIPPPPPATAAATRPPSDRGKLPGTKRRGLSTRARILAGAGVGVVLILVIVTIVANSRTTSGSAESVLFQDDFSTTANGWADAGSTRAGGHYHNGTYRIYAKPATGGSAEGSSPTSANSVYPSAPPKVSIQVEAQRLAGDQDTWYGIACRANPNNSNIDYVFLVGDGHAEIGKEDASSGYQTLKGVDTSSLDADAKNSLDADCNGDEGSVYLNLYVNGELVAEWTDETNSLPNGTVALFVATGPKANTAVEAEFDNFAVTQN